MGTATPGNGGGGAGLGGAIFNYGGTILIRNSTFSANYAAGGRAKGGHTGDGHGGAIFSLNGSTSIVDATIAANQSTGSASGIYVFQTQAGGTWSPTTFLLHSTIIANNGGSTVGAAKQCTMAVSVITAAFSGNLIQNDDPDYPCDSPQAPGVVSTADPQLGTLQLNGGFTPTMAIRNTSPAYNKGDSFSSLPAAQRGQPRPAMGGYDIGAFELCVTRFGWPCIIRAGGTTGNQTQPMTIQASPAGYGTTNPAPWPIRSPCLGYSGSCASSALTLRRG